MCAVEQPRCSHSCLVPALCIRNERKTMNANVSTDRLVSDLKTVARDIEELLKASAGEVGDKAREARARLTDALERAKESWERLLEKAFAGAKATDKVIRPRV